ncbi:uncharacterized protein LAJ45_07736 [Morchella importuna]|uniref:uncharacterized protein n=1 Tax=Morchella importuna TaxID=1174673 RepID=UPI001E8E9567|nr:uncharacterized protein LAJ45_07736 [Morchella importuna]KAH8148283.1 hypothetical protein LAJ45_07736 [Morchella importuna]
MCGGSHSPPHHLQSSHITTITGDYPGPLLAALTKHYIDIPWLTGRYPTHIHALHQRYGPVVRISPDELSYASASSWKDIYGTSSTRKPFLKSAFYDDGTAPSIVSARDPATHRRIHRLLSPGFTARSIGEQEPLVQGHVDLFLSQVGRYATGSEGGNMVGWYTWVAFNIIGGLAFGEPFGSLDDGKPHFGLRTCLARWPRRRGSGRLRRIARKDLLSVLVAQHTSGDSFTTEEIRGNAGNIIVAGSETTASFLCGVTWYLGRGPAAYKKLTDEIRSAFSSYEDINGRATEHLVYLKAVIEEGLRLYPPVGLGAPRVSPGETVDECWVSKGTVVMSSFYAAGRSEDNFHRPDDFLPERWIDPECTDKNNGSQPFLLGSRVCIGRALVLLEIRLIMAKMLWAYNMELVDPAQEWLSENGFAVVWEKPALYVRYTRRQGVGS